MAELWHSLSLGSRATSSPMKRDGVDDSSPLIPENDLPDDRHSPKDRDYPLCSFFTDDPRVPLQNSRISLFFTLLLLLVTLLSIFTILNKLNNSPYLCKKDGIVLHCPHVKESPSLWENPYSSTTSWKLCAEHRDGAISGFLWFFCPLQVMPKPKGLLNKLIRTSSPRGYDNLTYVAFVGSINKLKL